MDKSRMAFDVVAVIAKCYKQLPLNNQGSRASQKVDRVAPAQFHR